MLKARFTRRESYARRMARRSAAAKAQAEAAAKAEENLPDEPPDDMDKFRNKLARRLNMILSNQRRYWRGCKEPACRRQRACAAPNIHCSNAPPLPPSTPEATARAVAHVQRTINKVLAQRGEAE